MEKITSVLKYIQFYTNCSDFTLKRLSPLLEDLYISGQKTSTIVKKEVVYIERKKKIYSIKKWADNWLKNNSLVASDIVNKRRNRDVIKNRNEFCVGAYKDGYGYAEIGRYLGKNHATIMHSVSRLKKKFT